MAAARKLGCPPISRSSTAHHSILRIHVREDGLLALLFPLLSPLPLSFIILPVRVAFRESSLFVLSSHS